MWDGTSSNISAAWRATATPTVAALVAIGARAARALEAAEAAKAGGTDVPPALKAAAAWADRATETLLIITYSPSSARVAVALLPFLLAAQAAPDKDTARLAAGVLASASHALIFPAAPEVSSADAEFVRSVARAAAAAAGDPAIVTAAVAVVPPPPLPSSALHALATGASSPTESLAAVVARTLAHAATTAASYFVRRGAIVFLGAVRARNIVALPRDVDRALTAVVRAALTDAQPETAEAAGDTLVGCIATLSPAEKLALSRAALKTLATKPPARIAPPDEAAPPDALAAQTAAFKAFRAASATAARARHAAVLTVAAVARAHPHDVPEFLPALLAALARHANDVAPVGAAVKKALAAFRASHADNWEKVRAYVARTHKPL